MPIPAGILLGAIPYNKPALTYEQQLDLKLIPRGLVIEDRARALGWLRRVGYYRLSGYLYPYRVSAVDDNFRAGATFDTAVSVYKFDCELRLLLLQAIDRIEVAIRASITYHLGHELGPFGHMSPASYKPYVPPIVPGSSGQGLDFKDFGGKVVHAEKQSSEVFVAHYRAKYSNPDLPVWMLTEIVSFGFLSRLTENLIDKQIQRKIARDFGLSQSQLLSWLQSLCYIRNVCAHHGRLWNRTLSVKPELLPKWRKQGVTRDRLYVVLLMMLHLLEQIAPQSQWKRRMRDHLLSNMDVSLSAMNCPGDWYQREPWIAV
jgi:abortive infection bacteriophage resistance protein